MLKQYPKNMRTTASQILSAHEQAIEAVRKFVRKCTSQMLAVNKKGAAS
jgi:hypothetical protein